MAKMRVHELAKELEIESKVIVEFLKGTEHEVKSAQSGVEDDVQALVRQKFSKKTESPAAEKKVEDQFFKLRVKLTRKSFIVDKNQSRSIYSFNYIRYSKCFTCACCSQ